MSAIFCFPKSCALRQTSTDITTKALAALAHARKVRMSWRAWRSRSERARYAKSVLVAQTCAQFLLKAGREAGIGAVRMLDDPRQQVLKAGRGLQWRESFVSVLRYQRLFTRASARAHAVTCPNDVTLQREGSVLCSSLRVGLALQMQHGSYNPN